MYVPIREVRGGGGGGRVSGGGAAVLSSLSPSHEKEEVKPNNPITAGRLIASRTLWRKFGLAEVGCAPVCTRTHTHTEELL